MQLQENEKSAWQKNFLIQLLMRLLISSSEINIFG